MTVKAEYRQTRVLNLSMTNESAAAVVGLDAEDALQMRRVHLAVFGVYILASA